MVYTTSSIFFVVLYYDIIWNLDSYRLIVPSVYFVCAETAWRLTQRGLQQYVFSEEESTSME